MTRHLGFFCCVASMFLATQCDPSEQVPLGNRHDDGGAGDASSGDGGGDDNASSGDGGGADGGGRVDGGGPTADGGVGTTGCGPFTSGTNLHVCAATELGGPTDDDARAVAFLADGTIAVAGAIAGNDFGVTPTALLGGGNGVVLRFDPLGRKVVSVTRIGTAVRDAAVDPSTHRLAVVGDFGVAVLDPTAASVVWSRGGTPAEHVAFGADGTLATTHGADLAIFPAGAAGDPPLVVTAAGPLVDVAVDSAHAQIVAAGSVADATACHVGGTFKSAFLASYSLDGKTLRWKSYGWSATEASAADACQPSYANAITLGADGLLYFAAGAANPKNVLEHAAHDLAAPAPLVGPDSFQTLDNPNGVYSAFLARIDPTTGDAVKATWLTGREDPDGGGRVGGGTAYAITADAKGQIYAAGVAYDYMANRAALQIEGTPVGFWFGGDGFALVLSSDMTERRVWTTWTNTGEASFYAIAMNGSLAAVVGASPFTGANGDLITVHAVQPKAAGGADAFLSVFPTP